MSRAKKLAAKILEGRSDANLDFDDLCYILERLGFIQRRGKGSHIIYFMEGVEEILSIQARDGKAKPYQVRQVRDIIIKYQLEAD